MNAGDATDDDFFDLPKLLCPAAYDDFVICRNAHVYRCLLCQVDF